MGTTQKASPQEPGLESKVITEDAPIDHASAKKGVSDAIYEIGSGGKGIEPVKTKWFQSGKFPHDEFFYWLGTDNRVYGKGQKMPEGVNIAGILRAVTMVLNGEWHTRMFIVKEGEVEMEDLAVSDSGSGDPVQTDPNDPSSAPKKFSWQSRELFAARDPKTSARQALNELQTKGFLHDPTRAKNINPLIIKIFVGFAILGLGFFLLTLDRGQDDKKPQYTFRADGGLMLDNKIYYAVKSNDSTGDTGKEVCQKAGKACVGYTALSLGVCLAFHPGALTSEDFNGSRAGFYCNGAPQGGICAEEANTCHICPQCNLNMECDTEIGDFYRETFVECK